MTRFYIAVFVALFFFVHIFAANMETMDSMNSIDASDAENSADAKSGTSQALAPKNVGGDDKKSEEKAKNKKRPTQINSAAAQKKVAQKAKVAKRKTSDELAVELALKEPALSPYEIDSEFVPVSDFDAIVLENLQSKNLKPAKLCTDSVFIRRVFLDLTGQIPGADEVSAFISDKSPDKRAKLVDKLLASDRFCEYFAEHLSDILRIKAEFPVNLWPNAAQAYHRFIYKSLRDNLGWDKIVHKMLVSEGSNFRCGEVNFFRAMQSKTPENIASCVALSFMGMRYDSFTESRKKNLSAFFDRLSYKSTKEWKEEIVFENPAKRAAFVGVFPDGKTAVLSTDDSPRRAFAEWLTAKGNPCFARAMVNRMWSWVFGTPIVSPVDDMFASNLPVSQKLLDALAADFEKSGFDIRAFCRNTVLSRTYQQSSFPQSEPLAARGNFGVYPIRQLEAEQLIDAVCKISGTTDIYVSTTPEPYTTMPDYAGAVSIPDGSISSSFLELFGKPSRDTGYDSERVLIPSTSQRLHMLNSSHIRRKIENGPDLKKIYGLGGQKAFERLSLAVLSRYPTAAERVAFRDYNPVAGKSNSWAKLVDSAWAMINSEEFMNRH